MLQSRLSSVPDIGEFIARRFCFFYTGFLTASVWIRHEQRPQPLRHKGLWWKHAKGNIILLRGWRRKGHPEHSRWEASSAELKGAWFQGHAVWEEVVLHWIISALISCSMEALFSLFLLRVFCQLIRIFLVLLLFWNSFWRKTGLMDTPLLVHLVVV